MKAKKMLFLATALSVFSVNTVSAQKKKLTIEDLKHWPHLAYPVISGNGKYASYTVMEQPVNGQTLYVKSVSGNWQRTYKNASGLAFTTDSKTAVFKQADTLHFVRLGTAVDQLIPAVTRFQVIAIGDKGCTLYQTKDNILHLLTDVGKVTVFENVENYQLSKNSRVLLLKKRNALSIFNISTSNETIIFNGKAAQTILDNEGRNIAFTSASDKMISYHLYHNGSVSTVTGNNLQNPDSMDITGFSHFSKDGKRLFVKAKEKPQLKPAPGAVMVDVWNWKDKRLQSEQLNDLANPPVYTSMLDIGRGTLKRLEYDGEQLMNIGALSTSTDTLCIVVYDYLKKQLLRNIVTGEDRLLPAPCQPSPDGKYLFYTDSLKMMAYDVSTGRTHKFFDVVPDVQKIDYPYDEYMIAIGWKNSTTGFFYDKYDIWELDITGRTAPKNLTNGYGRKKNIRFRTIDKDKVEGGMGILENGLPYPLLLSAFDPATKDNGFYVVDKAGADPRKLSMGPYAYCSLGLDAFRWFKEPIKALFKNVFLVSRESLNESENYFITKDFKSFSPVSDFHPGRPFAKIQNELINFTTLDGKPSQAILYKPENFDPNKKYPLIVTYYEKLSQQKNMFPVPQLPETTINIPWELQRGYMVLAVDIYYTVGQAGRSALNAVEGVTNEMVKRNYIDHRKIGIIGHSFGGFETNYIISHSNRFACAITSSGASSMVTTAINLLYNGTSLMDFVQKYEYRMGGTVWSSKKDYIDNSPLFDADKITSPLLMMANKKDGIVNFSEGIAMYQALKRLNKPVWLLQYDKGVHTLISENESIDRLKRFGQFFDHYLKGKAIPDWMEKGVPAKFKGLQTGY